MIIIILLSLDVEKVGTVCVVVIWEGGKQDRFVGSAKTHAEGRILVCRLAGLSYPPGDDV